MGKSVNDKVYFPLSDDWRKSEGQTVIRIACLAEYKDTTPIIYFLDVDVNYAEKIEKLFSD